MIDLIEGTVFLFVVDTEQYAGNYERDMCAYMTGIVGECGVGGEEAALFREEMGVDEDAFDDERHPFQFIILEADEHGCCRPVTIFPTPGWFNNGLGGNFREGDEAAAQAHYAKEAKKHKLGDRQMGHYPCCNSLAIFMERAPTEEERATLVVRAITYATRSKIKVTGFRLIARRTTHSLEWELKNQ